jgi:polyhydroxyalkanoate synthase
MAEHLLSEGRPTYLVDYGPIEFSDKELGLEHWVNDVLPQSIEKVSQDSGGQSVQLAGWCLGGLMGLITVAAHPDLPVNSLAMVPSPIDTSKLPLSSGLRRIAGLTQGGIIGNAVRTLGGVPAKINEIAFKGSSWTTFVKKPLTVIQRRDDREFLAHIEAVDELMDNMYAYPGRTMGQLYHRFFLANELHANGKVVGPNREVDISDVRVPVMNIAGAADVLAPVDSARGILDILPAARFEIAPGGHLGVLTGRKARETTWAYIADFFASNTPAAVA